MNQIPYLFVDRVCSTLPQVRTYQLMELSNHWRTCAKQSIRYELVLAIDNECSGRSRFVLQRYNEELLLVDLLAKQQKILINRIYIQDVQQNVCCDVEELNPRSIAQLAQLLRLNTVPVEICNDYTEVVLDETLLPLLDAVHGIEKLDLDRIDSLNDAVLDRLNRLAAKSMFLGVREVSLLKRPLPRSLYASVEQFIEQPMIGKLAFLVLPSEVAFYERILEKLFLLLQAGTAPPTLDNPLYIDYSDGFRNIIEKFISWELPEDVEDYDICINGYDVTLTEYSSDKELTLSLSYGGYFSR